MPRREAAYSGVAAWRRRGQEAARQSAPRRAVPRPLAAAQQPPRLRSVIALADLHWLPPGHDAPAAPRDHGEVRGSGGRKWAALWPGLCLRYLQVGA